MNLATVIDPRTRRIDPVRVRTVLAEPIGSFTLQHLLSTQFARVRTHERVLSPGQGRHTNE